MPYELKERTVLYDGWRASVYENEEGTRLHVASPPLQHITHDGHPNGISWNEDGEASMLARLIESREAMAPDDEDTIGNL